MLSTETPVAAFDWRDYSLVDEVLDMRGVSHGRSVPLLNAHSRYDVSQVLGSVREFSVAGGTLSGRGYLADKQAVREEVDPLIRDGHLDNVSVGFVPRRAVLIDAGQSADIKGKRFTAGERKLRVVTEWTLREVSLVPVGADANAVIRSVPMAGNPAVPPAPTTDTPAANPPAIRSEAEIVRAERERVRAIRTEADGLNVPSEIVQRCIDEGSSLDEARTAFLGAMRTRGEPAPQPTASPSGAVRDRSGGLRDLELGLALRAGLKLKADDADRAERFRRYSLMDFTRAAMALDGVDTHGLSAIELAQRAPSTVSLPTILNANLTRAVTAAIDTLGSTSAEWTYETDVSTFNTERRGRLADVTQLQQLANGADIPSGQVAEHFETVSAKPYGQVINLTWMDIVNDNMSFFNELPMRLADAAIRAQEDAVYTTLLANAAMSDSVALFHATHNNLTSGAATVLGDTPLATLKQKMRQQKDRMGTPLNINGATLLVPPELEHTAVKLAQSSMVLRSGGSTSTAEQYGEANVWRGLKVVVEPRLSASTFHASASPTAYYLVADQRSPTHLARVYLRGDRGPMIQRKDPAPNQTGLVWQCLFAVGAAALDFRGIQKCTGAA